jgi:large subunit ribosomal protein L7/L12
MQSEKTDAIVEELKTLTLLEASELVKAIEETFDVDASAGGGAVMMAAPAAAEEEAAPEKSEFDVTLKEVPKDKKIAILKVVRSLLGVGLKEAKGMVDNPGKIMEGKPKDICDDAKTQLEEAGAKVEVA